MQMLNSEAQRTAQRVPGALPCCHTSGWGPVGATRGGGWVWISKQTPDYLPVSWGLHWWIKSCFPAPLGLGPGHSTLGKGAGVLCGAVITIVILHLGCDVCSNSPTGDVESTALVSRACPPKRRRWGLTQDTLLFRLAAKLSGNPPEELVEAARERRKSGQMVTRQDETIFRVPICVCVCVSLD